MSAKNKNIPLNIIKNSCSEPFVFCFFILKIKEQINKIKIIFIFKPKSSPFYNCNSYPINKKNPYLKGFFLLY